MKDYKYLFDKNIEINLTANDNSINYKDNANITSVNKNFKSPYNYNLLLPSYNPRQNKDEKSSSLINKFLNKKEDFFKEKNEYNDNKISKLNSKYSTCNNYYPRKNYNKFLNSHQQTNSSIINNINIFQQNTTFEGLNGYNKLNTRDLIEITKRRKKIIEQKKIKDEEQKKEIEKNLNKLENIDIIINKNLNNSGGVDKKYCDEGVQTSLININEQEDENNNNKKEEPLSTIIFTDKSALINQEITFLSIQCSLKNNGDNNDDSKEYKCTDNDFVNIGCDVKDSIIKDKNQNQKKINKKNENNKNNIKNSKIINKSIISNNIEKENKIEIINKDTINEKCDNNNNKSDNGNNNKDEIIGMNKTDENNNNLDNFNNDKDLDFFIVNNTLNSPTKNINEMDDQNYITGEAENFQIESNDKIPETKKDNNDDNNFTITNNNINNPNDKEDNKILNDSLEDSNDNIINNPINNNINNSKSLTNSDENENELTEVEEYDQNLIFLQNESKTMSSHFDKIRNDKKNNEENEDSNKEKILIEDTLDNKNIEFNINNNNNNDNDISFENLSKKLDKEKDDSLNNITSSLNSKKEYEEKNINDIYNTNNNKFSYKENIFRTKGKKNNSLNKYNDYPTLRNINLKENNSLKSKLFNNNYTNNNRYQNKYQNLEEKDNNDCYDLLKLKTTDLKLNNQEEKIIIKSLKNSNDNNNQINEINNNPNNNNIKFFSHKKLNTNTNTNSSNKNNIDEIPIRHNKIKNNSNINININKAILNNNTKSNLKTPRCTKKKRQLNNYAEYYKLKMSMCSNNSINYANNNNFESNNHNKNYRSLGHKKSSDNFNK